MFVVLPVTYPSGTTALGLSACLGDNSKKETVLNLRFIASGSHGGSIQASHVAANLCAPLYQTEHPVPQHVNTNDSFGDQADHGSLVSRVVDGVGALCDMDEQGVEEVAEHATMRYTSVDIAMGWVLSVHPRVFLSGGLVSSHRGRC